MNDPIFPTSGNPYSMFSEEKGMGAATRWVSAKLTAGAKKAFALRLEGKLEGPHACRYYVWDHLNKAIEEKDGMRNQLSNLGFFDSEPRNIIDFRQERLFQCR